MNMALAEIGRYTGVDRLATWENHLDGVTYGCTNEWCNDGIEPAIDYLRSMTIEAGKPWFDMLEENHIICTSDIYSLDPFITQMLEVQGVKAIAVFPLSQLGVHFGFLSFNFCWNKQWDEKDVELMARYRKSYLLLPNAGKLKHRCNSHSEPCKRYWIISMPIFL